MTTLTEADAILRDLFSPEGMRRAENKLEADAARDRVLRELCDEIGHEWSRVEYDSTCPCCEGDPAGCDGVPHECSLCDGFGFLPTTYRRTCWHCGEVEERLGGVWGALSRR